MFVRSMADVFERTEGEVVAIDGKKREIAAQIVERGADYVLPVKGNQPHLLAEVQAALEEAIPMDFAGVEVHDSASTEETGHGRQEKRELWCMQRPATVDPDGRWVGSCAIALIRRTRTVGGKTSVEDSDYISSLPGKDARVLLDAIRAHWSVENQLHWRLDVQFREDDVRIRAGNSAENVGRLRQMTLDLLKQEKTAKVGIANKRLMAGWNNDYLRKVIGL